MDPGLNIRKRTNRRFLELLWDRNDNPYRIYFYRFTQLNELINRRNKRIVASPRKKKDELFMTEFDFQMLDILGYSVETDGESGCYSAPEILTVQAYNGFGFHTFITTMLMDSSHRLFHDIFRDIRRIKFWNSEQKEKFALILHNSHIYLERIIRKEAKRSWRHHTNILSLQ